MSKRGITVLIIVASELVAAEGSSWMHRSGNVANDDAPANREIYDGNWWLSVSFDERLGFYSGYDDCYTFDVKGPPLSGKPLGWGPYDYVPAISEYYERHPQDRPLSLLEVIVRIRKTASPRPETKGGEVWREPHGYYNGQWWWQASDDTRIGYVKGYLWCYGTMMAKPSARFSKPAGTYRSLMDHYIESNPKADSEKLAHILFRFRDPMARPPQEGQNCGNPR